ncbi:hypothetical protein V6N11_061546 [Hibiscus sabdariffa]|uniref:Ubiquitin-like protease family profile domain-containing protein n=1 Tax=Hibiscus sabdariffa TaxID=183260 RepID=A0ABR2NVW4_9ROSI
MQGHWWCALISRNSNHRLQTLDLLFTRPDFIALRSAFTIKTWTFLELNSDEIQLSSAAPEDISAVIGIALTISKLSHICEKEILRVQYCLD